MVKVRKLSLIKAKALASSTKRSKGKAQAEVRSRRVGGATYQVPVEAQ